jgi:hypothetical protein
VALTLVKETGTASASANSYANANDGDGYHDGHLYATDWTGASTGNKEAALVMATRLIDDYFTFEGRKVDEDQALEWPRFNTYDRSGYLQDSDNIPRAVLNATCEMARWLLGADRTAEEDTLGFTEMKAGPLNLKIDPFDRSAVFPDVVKKMLAPYARPFGGGFLRARR